MTIPFKQIPQNLRVPLFYAEVDPSHANSATLNQRALIIGQITSSGAATPGVPIISQGIADAKTQGGSGSMLALMTAAYRANDNFGEVWYLPLADASGGASASGTIQITSQPTANGVLALYIGGQLVSVPITAGMTTAQAASSINNTIMGTTGTPAMPDLPVTSSVSSSTVTFTAKNKGTVGNDIDVRVAYRGASGGEITPAGLAYIITAMSGGSLDPSGHGSPDDLTAALGNLLDLPFDFIVFPYTDTTSLNVIKTFLNDVTGRWSWTNQIYGHAFAASRGTYAALANFGASSGNGAARNDQHTSIMGFYDSPTMSCVCAAALAAQAAVSARADPGTPMQTLPLIGVLAPPLASRFNLSTRNSLLYDGVSTFTVDVDGTVRIENLITTYQQNSFGAADNSYLEVETMHLLTFILRALKTVVTSKYSQVKLAANGTRFAPGSNIVTPNIIRADLIAMYQQLEYNGYVQNSTAFAENLIVQQNASNPNRLDVLYPAVLIDQLRVFALLMQFRLF